MSKVEDGINTKIIEQLECPICFELSTPPIFSCTNGHSVCGKCRENLRDCGVCRAPGMPSVRCFSLENIANMVRLPCENKPYGCRERATIGEMKAHTNVCSFTPSAYCILCVDWKGPTIKSFTEHLKVVHKAKELPVNCKGIYPIKTSIFKPGNKNICNRIIWKGGANFWLRMEFKPLAELLICSVRLISSRAADLDFFYTIELKVQKSCTRFFVAKEVSSLKELETEACMNITIQKSYTDEADKSFSFTFTINSKNSVIVKK